MDAFLAHGQELDASQTKYHANPFKRFAIWVLNPIEPSLFPPYFAMPDQVIPCRLQNPHDQYASNTYI